tara:strand:- start:10618 stop:11292 length:675 start_codon:yes stop_codon:yes gene_type:complete
MLNYTQYNDKKYIIYQSDKYNDGKPKPPFHDDKKMIEITLNILDEMEVFIETGSFMGKTIFFVGKNFPGVQCYSCEIDQKSYNIAYEQVQSLSNVNLSLKPSPYALYDISNILNNNIFSKKCLFWLDAHWHTDPLYDEIKHITSNYKRFCIFVDDFTVPYDKGFHTDGYDIEKIKPYIMNKGSLKFYMPNYSSNDECCKKNPCGYIIITNIEINTFKNLKEIFI